MNARDIALVQRSCLRIAAMDAASDHQAFARSQTSMLQGADALQLYLAAIGHNLEAIDEQLALLRGAIIERKRLQREFDLHPSAGCADRRRRSGA